MLNNIHFLSSYAIINLPINKRHSKGKAHFQDFFLYLFLIIIIEIVLCYYEQNKYLFFIKENKFKIFQDNCCLCGWSHSSLITISFLLKSILKFLSSLDNIYFQKYIVVKEKEEVEDNSNKLIEKFLVDCFYLAKIDNKRKKKKTLFYFHDINKFFFFLLLKNLTDNLLYTISIISRDNKIYSLIIKENKTNLSIEIRDSFLLLPLSIDQINNTFCKFPKILNLDILKNTDFKVFQKKSNLLNDLKYNQFLYCNILKEGFLNYLLLLIQKLNINPFKSYSLPGLALRYFRMYCYDSRLKPISYSKGNIYGFIKESYKGGTVEVYKPYMKNGYNYDVNGLYPYIMSTYELPIGNGTWVKKIESWDSFYGFAEVFIESPTEMYIPFLSYYCKERGLISPLGKWRAILFSEEIKYAISLGYKITFISGISYQKAIIFDKYVEKLYTLRILHKDNNALNTIIKLLLNSLYGRFGIKDDVLITKIMNFEEFNKINLLYTIEMYEVLSFSSILVRYWSKPNLVNIEELFKTETIDEKIYLELKQQILNIQNNNSAVHLSSAITSYARIYMHKIISNTKDVYYMDTDSIHTTTKLNENLVSQSELGKFKLVSFVKEGIYLGPKAYMYTDEKDQTVIKYKGVPSSLIKKEHIYDLYHKKDVNSPLELNSIQEYKKNNKNLTVSRYVRKLSLNAPFLKREKVFNSAFEWIDTKPIKLN